LKEKHGNGFESFIQEKVCPLPGDIMYENLGLGPAKLREIWKEIDIIVNGAATTNFYERSELVSVNKIISDSMNIVEIFVQLSGQTAGMMWLSTQTSWEPSTSVSLQRGAVNSRCCYTFQQVGKQQSCVPLWPNLEPSIFFN